MSHDSTVQFRHHHASASKDAAVFEDSPERDVEAHESSPLTSRSASSGPGDITHARKESFHRGHSPLDIRGFSLLREAAFWQLFTTMALISGVGLMTIK